MNGIFLHVLHFTIFNASYLNKKYTYIRQDEFYLKEHRTYKHEGSVYGLCLFLPAGKEFLATKFSSPFLILNL